ncbi:hypothetical protein V8G54_028136 [Vigna mungo]|uniref:DUF7081 domain-containing protein n=1 Tax=Vigna mungo TaxID=3915 RepID=A0AAQ3MS31_VIGMU
MKKNDSAIGNNPYKDVTNDKTSALQRVPSKSSGEGLPYAPEGWPNAGDVWERGSKDFHLEILPTDSLSPRHDSRILEFSSRKGVIKYLESKFPNMSPKDFFAMFTWLIPSAEQTPTQG